MKDSGSKLVKYATSLLNAGPMNPNPKMEILDLEHEEPCRSLESAEVSQAMESADGKESKK